MRTTFSAVILFDEGRLKGDSLEFGHFEGGISGNSDEVAVPSAAALALFMHYIKLHEESQVIIVN